MYGKVVGGGTVAALPLTGFYTGFALIVALILLVFGAILVRVTYLKRSAANDS